VPECSGVKLPIMNTIYRDYTFEVIDKNFQAKHHTVTASSLEEAEDDMEMLLHEGESISSFAGHSPAKD
jgi:hypothetical protein